MASPESFFLIRFFRALNERTVPYAVMRNYEPLPESLGGSDLDLLTIDNHSRLEIIQIAREVAETLDGKITCIYTVEATIMCLGGRLQDGRWWGLHLDIFPGLLYFGLPYLSTHMVFNQRVLERDTFYRCGSLSEMASFLKEIMPNKKTRKDYYPRAIQAYQNDPKLCQDAAIGAFGNKGWKIIKDLLQEERSADVIRISARRLTQALWLRQIEQRHVFSLIKVKIVNVWQRIHRLIQYPGFCVVFLGTDGSGKSTLIDAIIPFVYQMLHHPVEYYHLRPSLLPSIARLLGKPERQGPTMDPHASEPSGILLSVIRLLYYIVDYSAGYWIRIFPKLIKRPTMVIFDRYYYDYMLDQRRMCIKLPRILLKVVGLLVPSPDLVFCLAADPDVIYQRKPEISLDEVKRQVNELKAFQLKNKRAIWIDTGCSIDESVNQVISSIIECMAKRYEKS